MQATPTTDTVSPVTATDLAAFIGVDAADPLLAGILTAATDAAIRYLGVDLIQRSWLGLIKAPEPTGWQLSPYKPPQTTFELPYTALVSVESVMTTDLTDVQYVLQAKRKPARIMLLDWDYHTDIEVEYTAGLAANAAGVPAAIKSGIMMLAAFLYDHRGDCDAMDAIKRSGAANLLKPHRVEVAL